MQLKSNYLTYKNAVKLVQLLKAEKLEAWISTKCVRIQLSGSTNEMDRQVKKAFEVAENIKNCELAF